MLLCFPFNYYIFYRLCSPAVNEASSSCDEEPFTASEEKVSRKPREENDKGKEKMMIDTVKLFISVCFSLHNC